MISLPDFPSGWCCYLLLCSDGSFYCGIASDLTSRIRDHASGKGSGYTKGIKPITLLWYEPHPNRRAAAARELQIKKWSRAKKQGFAEGTPKFEGLGIRVNFPIVVNQQSAAKLHPC